jgi:hypothetical protein
MVQEFIGESSVMISLGMDWRGNFECRITVSILVEGTFGGVLRDTGPRYHRDIEGILGTCVALRVRYPSPCGVNSTTLGPDGVAAPRVMCSFVARAYSIW